MSSNYTDKSWNEEDIELFGIYTVVVWHDDGIAFEHLEICGEISNGLLEIHNIESVIKKLEDKGYKNPIRFEIDEDQWS